MSEFGSSKSFSSVSEPSSSQPSSSDGPPPDPSSSHSSEELHTCHRCGDCCFSDKSRLLWSFFEENFGGRDREEIANLRYECTAGGQCRFYGVMRRRRSDTGTGDWETPTWHPFQAYREGAAWIFRIGNPFSTESAAQAVIDTAVVSCDAIGNVYVDRSLGCCGGTLVEVSGPTTTTTVITLSNNPCCLGDDNDCWQHFNGDCRGRCDEEPSSGSSAGSSDENPLP